MKNKRKILIPFMSSCLLCFLLIVGFQHIASSDNSSEGLKKGKVYLIGMGPGDPDLATIRAVRIVKEADLVICYESLKERFIRILVDKDVMTIPMDVWIWHGYGKKASDFQGKGLERFQASERLRSQVVSKVRQEISDGKRVTILASGDPMIYCPWSWILNELDEKVTSVIPGLSSFNAANAALKKVVTSGRYTKSIILTMTDLPDRPKTDTIERLAKHQATLVIFMPTVRNSTLSMLVGKLTTHYLPQTPIAIVSYAGCNGKEQVVRGTLEDICNRVGEQKLPFETLVYVGDFLTNTIE